MKALTLQKHEGLVMTDVAKPIPGSDELLVRTKAATICTSDIQDMKYNPFNIALPVIMGHEGAGIIEAVGVQVAGFKQGDAITAHPVHHCGKCESCKIGLEHLCDDMAHFGINKGGVFAEYFTVRFDRARKKPKELSFPQATLMEPVCVCIESIERASVKEGGIVLILGDGPFGIMASRLCQSYNPGKIISTGRHPFRMSIARNNETVETINERLTDNIIGDILALTDGRGVDSAILCAGSNAAVDAAIEVLRPRGTLSVFASPEGKASVDLFRVNVKELNICGSCNDMDYLDKALDFLCDKCLGLQSMITHELAFEDWRKAFDLAEKGKDEALKVSMIFE